MPGVTVAWCGSSVLHVVDVRVRAGATVLEAIRQSGLLERFPEIDLDVNRVGIFNKLCEPGAVVRAGDRVEIYRPLIADPKAARRRRAARAQGQ